MRLCVVGDGSPNLGTKSVETGLHRANGPFRFVLMGRYAQFNAFIFQRPATQLLWSWVADGADFESPAHANYTRSRCCGLFCAHGAR
jgi:hypothetical protein